MDSIFNDYSLSGQYKRVDDFLDDLQQNMIPILDQAKKLRQKILKSYSTYSQLVTPADTLHRILITRGNPIITKLKLQLINLVCEEPYWNDDIKTDLDSIYECINNALSPNCFSEALERSGCLISFGKEYYSATIEIKKNSTLYYIQNGYNKNSYIESLYFFNQIDEIYYLQNIDMDFDFEFYRSNTQNFFECADLNKEDKCNIIDDIKLLASHLINKTDPGNLIKHLGKGLYEIRGAISDERIYRIFFARKTNGIVLYNGIIKKSQDTPKRVLDLARILLKEYTKESDKIS